MLDSAVREVIRETSQDAIERARETVATAQRVAAEARDEVDRHHRVMRAVVDLRKREG